MATKHDHFLIADTSGLLSLVHPDDSNHAQARHAEEHLPAGVESILIPYEVFLETMNVAGRHLGHHFAVALADRLMSTPLFSVLDTPENVRREALNRFSTVAQSVSFTDCMVVAVADEYRSTSIFGFDQAFERHGYRIISNEALEPAA